MYYYFPGAEGLSGIRSFEGGMQGFSDDGFGHLGTYELSISYDSYILALTLLNVANTIGFNHLIDIINTNLNELPSNMIPTTPIIEFNVFLSLLSIISDQDVFSLLSLDEIAIFRAMFGGDVQLLVPFWVDEDDTNGGNGGGGGWPQPIPPCCCDDYDPGTEPPPLPPPPPQISIAFFVNGGNAIPDTQVIRAVAAGSPIGTMPVPARDGHIFVGWFNTSSPTGGVQFFAHTPAQGGFLNTLLLYARWQPITPQVPQVTVVFNANGGAPTPQSRSINVGSTLGGFMTTPSRAGYTFDGWFNDQGIRVFPTDPIHPPAHGGNVLLTARWRVNAATVAVTFDAGSGYVRDDAGNWVRRTTIYVPVGSTIDELPLLRRSGHLPLGWFNSPGIYVEGDVPHDAFGMGLLDVPTDVFGIGMLDDYVGFEPMDGIHNIFDQEVTDETIMVRDVTVYAGFVRTQLPVFMLTNPAIPFNSRQIPTQDITVRWLSHYSLNNLARISLYDVQGSNNLFAGAYRNRTFTIFGPSSGQIAIPEYRLQTWRRLEIVVSIIDDDGREHTNRTGLMATDDEPFFSFFGTLGFEFPLRHPDSRFITPGGGFLDRIGGTHLGIDMQRLTPGSNPLPATATMGERVYAAHCGVVIAAGWGGDGTGYWVVIRSNVHDETLAASSRRRYITSRYIHLRNNPEFHPTNNPNGLRTNQSISQGAHIGYVGNTGAPNSNGHLHLDFNNAGQANGPAIRDNGYAINAQRFFPQIDFVGNTNTRLSNARQQ